MSLFRRLSSYYVVGLRTAVMALASITGVCIMAMMLLTCADIIMRIFNRPIIGVYDLVRVAGAVAMSTALAYTTAVKGHVAIEYFFQKLNRTGRIIIGTITRTLVVAFFALLAKESWRIGTNLKIRGEVTATLQLPIFWVSWIIAICCILVVLVVLYNLVHPGKELVRP